MEKHTKQHLFNVIQSRGYVVRLERRQDEEAVHYGSLTRHDAQLMRSKAVSKENSIRLRKLKKLRIEGR
jgi:hypothetical protein